MLHYDSALHPSTRFLPVLCCAKLAVPPRVVTVSRGQASVLDLNAKPAVSTLGNLQLSSKHIGSTARCTKSPQLSSPSTMSFQQETQAASCRPFSYHKIHMTCSIICAVPAAIRLGAQITIGSCQPEECEEVTECVPPGVKSTKIAAHSRWGVTCGRWLPQNCSRPMLTLGGWGWR
jgi:hypothetical protein